MCSSRLLATVLLFSMSLLVSSQLQYHHGLFYGDPAVDRVPFEMYKRGPFQFHAARGKRGDFRNSKYGYFPSRGRRSAPELQYDQE